MAYTSALTWFFSLLICLFPGAVETWASSPLKVVDLNLPSPVQQWQKWEATFTLSRIYKNPFSPREIDVQCRFTTPSGKVETATAFVYRPYKRKLVKGREVLMAAGKRVWMIRYTPRKAGSYTGRITVRDRRNVHRSSPFTFTVSKSKSPGFVRISPINQRYFQFDDRSAYFPVGQNTCWPGAKGTYDYDRWWSKMAAQGANFGRLWLGPFTRFTLERKKRNSRDKAGLGRYDLANTWRLDYVLELAEKKGIYLMFCIESFNALRKTPMYPMWKDYPYNALNGGILHNPENFFTDTKARRYFRQRLRYLVARYGYSRHVMSWEFWNEVDLTHQYDRMRVAKWHREMGRYLRKIDPYQHLISTSFAGSSAGDKIHHLGEIDFVQTHNYGSRDAAAMVIKYCREKEKTFAKPHFIGEFGVDWQGRGNAADPGGIHFHHGLWAPLFCRSAGTGMLWWWDNYVEPKNLYHHYKPVAAFAAKVRWNQRKWKRLTAKKWTFVQAKTTSQPGTLLITPHKAGWKKAIYNRPHLFRVHQSGRVQPRHWLSRVLHGKGNHPHLHNPPIFLVNYPQPGKFKVRVHGVSGYGGGALEIWRGEKRVLVRTFQDTNPPGKHKTLHQYDRSYAVDVPAGKHVIKVVNPGRDWIYVSYELENYQVLHRPNLRFLGQVGDGEVGLIWVQNRHHTWYRHSLGKKAIPVEPTNLTLSGFKPGRYKIEWWNTYTGQISQTQTRQVQKDLLTITVPKVGRDVAAQIRKIK